MFYLFYIFLFFLSFSLGEKQHSAITREAEAETQTKDAAWGEDVRPSAR